MTKFFKKLLVSKERPVNQRALSPFVKWQIAEFNSGSPAHRDYVRSSRYRQLTTIK